MANAQLTARSDAATTDSRHGIWLGLTNNDVDAQYYPVFIASVDTTGAKGSVTLGAGPTNGVWYDPSAAFAYLSVGETAADTFSYTASDGHGGTSAATATVTVTGVNQAPVAAPDSARVNASGAVAVNVLANDTDVNKDDTLSVTALSTAGTKGRVSLGANGVVTYTAGTAFSYLAAGTTVTDTFGYTVSDNHGATAAGAVTVTVAGAWQRPTAAADTAATDARHAKIIDVLANDTDPQTGQTLSITAVNGAGALGTATVSNGKIVYDPGSAFLTLKAGAVATDTFAYTVSDGHGVSSTAPVTVTITGVNTPPVARNDTATTTAGAGIWLGLTNNDTDVNGDPLAVTAVNIAGTKGTAGITASSGAWYSPGSAFAYLSVGETATDSFTYTVSDGQGGTATASATVTVNGVNQAPVARAEAARTDAAHAIVLTPLANDTDVNKHDTLKVAALDTTGTRGSAVLNSDGTVRYTPGQAFAYLAAGSTAVDSFSYTVTDNHGAAATATDTVAVTGIWAPPVAVADAAVTDSAHAVTLNLLANDTDPQSGVTLSVASLNLTGTDGSAVINANGTVTYTPGAAFNGLAKGSATTDSFDYTLSDGHGSLSNGHVDLTVTAPGAPPAAPKAFYVATNGNDAWSGRLAAPNAAGTDGPLASLAAAQARMETTAVKTTYVEGGDYYLNTTLALTAADSGQSWLAMPGQAPVIHGGQAITGWTNTGGGIWTATAPAGAFAAGGGVADLFVNGVRETHARFPNAVPTAASASVTGGWLAAAPSLPGENTLSQFQFKAGDLPASLASATGLYAVVYQQNGWESFALPVASINATTSTVTLAGAAGHAIDAGSRYYLYNAASQLDRPGEWFYNPATNQVSLFAPAGFNGTGVTAGSLPNVVSDNGASNVTLAGLTITGGASTGAGVRIGNATGVTLAGDTITNVGNGVLFSDTGRNDTVEGCVIANTDDNGILIYPGTSNVTVAGNSIHDIGQLVNGSGIWFTGSSNDVITHNLVQNTAANGIGGGSSLGASDASYNDTISNNQVMNANLDSSDGGGIYIAGVQQTLTGDVVSGNLISGVTAAGTAASGTMQFLSPDQLVSFGIYLDDYASGVTVTGNMLTGNVGGIDVHSGWLNNITGNTLVNTGSIALQEQASNWRGPGAYASTGNVFSGNLVANGKPGAQLAVNLADPSAATWTDNYYTTSGLSAAAFVSDTSGAWKAQGLAAWQAAGFDAGSLSGPVTPGAATSYTLPAGSPAAALGVPGFSASQAGLTGYVAANPYELFGRG